MNQTNFSDATTLLRNAIGLAKEGLTGLQDSPKRKMVEEALERAEHQLQLAEAKVAVDLGYHLCKCTFPPQVALEERENIHKCPKCGREFENESGGCGGGCGE